MNYCNNYESPSDVIKRKAPGIDENPVAEFKKILTDYYNITVDSDYVTDYQSEAEKKEEFIYTFLQSRKKKDFPLFYSEMKFISDDPKTSEINAVDKDKSLLGIHVLESGIPIYGFLLGGEIEKPFFVMIYWNGETLRALIPEAGNTLNCDFYTGFGSEGYSTINNPEEVINEYEEFMSCALEDITCSLCSSEEELEFMAPGIVYCMKEGFAPSEEEAFEILKTVSWERIEKEINDFLERSNEIEKTEVI